MGHKADKRISEVRDKWDAIAEKQGNINDVDEFIAKNHEMVFNDLFELLALCKPEE